MQTDSKRFKAIHRSPILPPQCRSSLSPPSICQLLKAITVNPSSSVSLTRLEVPGDKIPYSNSRSTPISIRLRPDKVTEVRRRKCSSRQRWTLLMAEEKLEAIILFKSQMAKLHRLARPRCSSVRDHRKQEVPEIKSFQLVV